MTPADAGGQRDGGRGDARPRCGPEQLSVLSGQGGAVVWVPNRPDRRMVRSATARGWEPVGERGPVQRFVWRAGCRIAWQPAPRTRARPVPVVGKKAGRACLGPRCHAPRTRPWRHGAARVERRRPQRPPRSFVRPGPRNAAAARRCSPYRARSARFPRPRARRVAAERARACFIAGDGSVTADDLVRITNQAFRAETALNLSARQKPAKPDLGAYLASRAA